MFQPAGSFYLLFNQLVLSHQLNFVLSYLGVEIGDQQEPARLFRVVRILYLLNDLEEGNVETETVNIPLPLCKFRVRHLKFATYLKFNTCGNIKKINELRWDLLYVE